MCWTSILFLLTIANQAVRRILAYHVIVELIIYMVIGGACGFREFGRTVNDGSVAGVSRLFRNGTGCGACYQVK